MKDFNSAFNKSSNKPPKKTTPKLKHTSVLKGIVSFCALFFILFLVVQIPGKIDKPLKSIVIHGNDILDKNTIAGYLQITSETSWFEIDPFELSMRLKRLTWVDTVVVRKNFWQGIDIHITERSPIAFLRVKERTWFICKDGLILDLIQQKKVWDLPVIVHDKLTFVEEGKKLNLELISDAFGIIKLLNQNKALPLQSISEIIISDPINIQLVTMPHGIRINMGFEDFNLKLARLAKAISTLNEYIHNIDYIDLRHSDGVVFKKIK